MTCAFCGNVQGNRIWAAREMMFGTRDEFDYVECARCGSLAIVEPPDDMARYYPDDYHSLQPVQRPSRVKRALMRRWADASYGQRTFAGAFLRKLRGDKLEVAWVLSTGLPRSSRILDVGCGTGGGLSKMRLCGFTDLTGIDPYVPADIERLPGLRVLKGDLERIEGAYDLIMFHHSLEHMPDQRRALRRARKLLAPGGWVLVRVPVVNEAWRRYRTNWAELDPPRHLALHTPTGLTTLAAEAGFALDHVVYDSDAFELWASEQYARDIPLFDERSWLTSRRKSPFSRRDMRRFRKTVEEWNREGLSGRAAFYLRAAA